MNSIPLISPGILTNYFPVSDLNVKSALFNFFFFANEGGAILLTATAAGLLFALTCISS